MEIKAIGFDIGGTLVNYNKPQEMIYVGDEQKDIEGPQSVGMKAILIKRDDKIKEFGQDYTITKLPEIIEIVRRI